MSDILMIHPTIPWHSFHHQMHHVFHNQIASLYTVQEAKTATEAVRALNSPSKPKVILLVNGEICEKEYSKVISKITSYAKEGGTVIMCFQFSSAVVPTSSKVIFQKYLGLTWKLGTYVRQDFTLNTMFCNVFNTPLESTYNAKAVHISNASENSQVYMVIDELSRDLPVVFERYTETGFIGYIGDVNNETGSQAVLLAMLDKAINQNTQRVHLDPTTVKDVEANAGPGPSNSSSGLARIDLPSSCASQDPPSAHASQDPPSDLAPQAPQSGHSITSQSDLIQRRVPTTQPTLSHSSTSKPKKKNKKKKSKVPNSQSSQPSDPQDNIIQTTLTATQPEGGKSNKVEDSGTKNGPRHEDAQSSNSSDPQSDTPQTGAPVDVPSSLDNKSLICTHIDLSTMNITPTSNTKAPSPHPLGANSGKLEPCSVCKKGGHLRCGKCKVVPYCSKECQTSAWTTHKESCAGRRKPTQTPQASNPALSSPSLPDIFSGRFNIFKGQSHAEIYRRTIDIYRLRCNDKLQWEGRLVGLYAGGKIPISDFKDYLNKAKRCSGFLPSWWNLKSKEECIQIACDPEGKSYIGVGIGKAGIQKAYGNDYMPLMMRKCGERIFGSPIRC